MAPVTATAAAARAFEECTESEAMRGLGGGGRRDFADRALNDFELAGFIEMS